MDNAVSLTHPVFVSFQKADIFFLSKKMFMSIAGNDPKRNLSHEQTKGRVLREPAH